MRAKSVNVHVFIGFHCVSSYILIKCISFIWSSISSFFSPCFFTISWVRTWRRRRCPLRKDKYLRRHVIIKDRNINNSNKFLTQRESIQKEIHCVCTDETWRRKGRHDILFIFLYRERLWAKRGCGQEKKGTQMSLPHSPRPCSAVRQSYGRKSTTCYFNGSPWAASFPGHLQKRQCGVDLRRQGGETWWPAWNSLYR